MTILISEHINNFLTIVNLFQSIFWIYSGIKKVFSKDKSILNGIRNTAIRNIFVFSIKIFPLILNITLLVFDLMYSNSIDKYTIFRIALNTSVFVCYLLFLIIYQLIKRIRVDLQKQKSEIDKTKIIAYAGL